jgi:succinate dehydrogenase (ubiquinone) cytochrome b560 subunit
LFISIFLHTPVGVGGIGCASLAGVDVANMAVTLGNTNIVGPLLKFGVAFPLVYHYMGGVRHIMWDKAPDSLTNEAVQQSSLILIGAASAVSLGITML